MSGKSSTGFNRSGGGAADGSGGFAALGGSKLADGTEVRDVFLELEDTLGRAGYEKAWVDGWKREDGAVVTASYSYREVRVRRYKERRDQGGPQAIHDVKRYTDLDRLEAFIERPIGDWTEWSADGELVSR